VIDRPFSELVASLAARTPTPGGGAAAGLAAAMGSALFLMVVRFSRGKKANLARDDELAAAEASLAALHAEILPLAPRDSASFEPVAAAYRLPRTTEAERQARDAAIARGLAGATAVPMATLRLVAAALAAVLPVADCANRTIVSDLAAGASLLRAAAEVAFLNVRVNVLLAAQPDGAATLSAAAAHRDEVVRHHAALMALADDLLGAQPS
jgi:formiminotetrahydrofolate cyclodeaminase